MSKATIVSIVPLPITEQKPGVLPTIYKIPAAKKGEVQVLVIDDAITYQYIDETRGSQVIKIPATELGADIIRSYSHNSFEVEPGVREPGLFLVPESYTPALIKERFADILKGAEEKQSLWFQRLVEVADDDWAENRKLGNISPIQRLAAQHQGLSREWLTTTPEASRECPWCTTIIPTRAKVCKQCLRDVEPPKPGEAIQTAGTIKSGLAGLKEPFATK